MKNWWRKNDEPLLRHPRCQGPGAPGQAQQGKPGRGGCVRAGDQRPGNLPGYSELNDPDVQKERLEHQAAGETQRVDYDFIETLEYGMPSAGGIGIGIDRVIMMLTGASSIRDVLLFPQLKRKDS